MAGSNPEVEIIVACAYGDVGVRLRPNGLVRDWLLGNQFARVVDERPAKLSQKAAAKVGGASGGVKDAVKGLFQGR